MNDKKRPYHDKFKEALSRADAFVNLVTGMGGCEDFGQATVAATTDFKTKSEVEATYKDNALAGRIVDRLANDATREGFEISDTDESVDLSEIASDFEDLGVMVALNRVLKESRIYGGALLIPLVDDGQDPDKPLNLDNIKSFKGFRIVERYRATIDPLSLSTGAGIDFMNPEWYSLSTDERTPDGKILSGRIHRSRVMRFDGVVLPPDLLKRNGYWGMSVLESGWDNLRRLSTVRQYMENGVHNLTSMVLKIAGLTKMLKGAGADSKGTSLKEKIRQGIQQLRNNWNNMHFLALDKEDDISQSNQSATGLSDLEVVFVNAVVMDYDYPRELLTHEVKGVLNTGESAGAIRLYYDDISALQCNQLTPVVNRILMMYFAAKQKKIDKWSVQWNPLWQISETEKAANRKIDAEVDNIYFTMGVMESEEIRQGRLVEGQTGALVQSPEMVALEAAEEKEEEAEGEAEEAIPLEEPITPEVIEQKPPEEE